MKRSEMLKIIWDVLHPTEIGWEDLDGSLSEEVLKAIEKAGMLPPAKHVDIASGRILHYYIHDSIEESGTLSEIAEYWNWNLEETNILWEPEDERKSMCMV